MEQSLNENNDLEIVFNFKQSIESRRSAFQRKFNLSDLEMEKVSDQMIPGEYEFIMNEDNPRGERLALFAKRFNISKSELMITWLETPVKQSLLNDELSPLLKNINAKKITEAEVDFISNRSNPLDERETVFCRAFKEAHKGQLLWNEELVMSSLSSGKLDPSLLRDGYYLHMKQFVLDSDASKEEKLRQLGKYFNVPSTSLKWVKKYVKQSIKEKKLNVKLFKYKW